MHIYQRVYSVGHRQDQFGTVLGRRSELTMGLAAGGTQSLLLSLQLPRSLQV